MKQGERKAVIAAYKERKPAVGIYAVRCTSTGACWVGIAHDLEKIRNRLWFTLRQGANPHRSLQQAWRTHGEAAFRFEQVEQLEDDPATYLRDRILKARLGHWKIELQAESI